MRYLIGLICCFMATACFADEEEPREELALSTPDQLAALTSEPSYLIGDLISPTSGQPVLRQTDLLIRGAQNVALTRIYIPPYVPSAFPKYKKNQESYDKLHLFQYLTENYKGWQFLSHARLDYTPRLQQVRLTEPNGATLDFCLAGAQTKLVSPSYAISNAAGDVPSGKIENYTLLDGYSPAADCANHMQRKKKGEIDENLPDNPFNDPNLEDISHPKAREKGHYQFRDKETGEIIQYDKGKPGESGHEARDHYHRPNPNSTGNQDKYLDPKGNPVPKGSEPSHLYPPEWVWWN